MNTVTERPAALEIPTVAGTPFAGGFYAGRFFIGGQAYALIVAPKAEGELEESTWNKSRKHVAGATSYCDGLANTEAMVAVGSGLAKWARRLRIGGFDDWHLPSRLQALVMHGELSTLPDFEEDTDNGFALAWYWTSTQHAEFDDYAWFQSFLTGFQHYLRKNDELRARAVRMIRI
jgi:hypothetical protein